MILQNLHPWKLIHLSRVNRRWYEVALHPTMHRFLKDLCVFNVVIWFEKFLCLKQNYHSQRAAFAARFCAEGWS